MTLETSEETIESVEDLGYFDDEYVYDIGVDDDPWFFANNILVHNSVYFSAYPVLKDEIDNGNIPWNKDSVIKLYNQICEQANESFPDFMKSAFNCPYSRNDVIGAARETVGESGLFITKKRYAILVIDDEGERKDVDDKPGKIKAMGLDLRRADTPSFVQDFLREVLLMVLQDYPEKDILNRITEFREYFSNLPGWEQGTPKRSNNINYYQKLEEKQGKANLPGHVRASINWNTLKDLNKDNYSQYIIDGMKVVVCKLKQNPMGYTSVAYPTDEMRLPEWFKELPFDKKSMEQALIDKKLDNLIGVLGYDLTETQVDNKFNSLFEFD